MMFPITNVIGTSRAEKNEYDTKTTSTLVLTIGGLLKYTNYSILVRAFTKPGDGVQSAPVYCRTEEDGERVSVTECAIDGRE